ncbi:MAG: VWA domain-containing protein, partial [Thermoguttaceae bacterium]
SIVLVRSQLQSAADAAALAGASDLTLPHDEMIRAVRRQIARLPAAGNGGIPLDQYDVLPGTWHTDRRRFIGAAAHPNAIRITARSGKTREGTSPLIFSWLFDRLSFTGQASAVATVVPRDIALVVDLSGSMNDDTEPCWSIAKSARALGSEDESARRTEHMQQVYDDFGYGAFPGATEAIGRPFGVADDEYAYAALTCDGGPLTKPNVAARYRIRPEDNEAVRKKKAYGAIIDLQIARLMPAAKPAPSSSEHFDYWQRYLDFVVRRVKVGREGKGGPPSRRGWLPPDQASNRIDGMNSDSKVGRGANVSERFGNTIGYVTYVQFMMDHGRDGKPIGGHYVPLSRYSPHCPWNSEETPAGRFRFPPRAQPMHAVRRALIASLKMIKDRNSSVSDPSRRDRVSIITFDRLTSGGPRIAQSLTGDYDAAMEVCTRLQAVGDNGASTAIETGLLKAREHLRPRREGGQGRYSADKVVVLLTDGMPNLYSSSRSEIGRFIGEYRDTEFDNIDSYARDAALMQIISMRDDRWRCYAVGLGMGADHDYVDRLGNSGNAGGEKVSLRGPAHQGDDENRMVTLLEQILTNPRVRIVQ